MMQFLFVQDGDGHIIPKSWILLDTFSILVREIMKMFSPIFDHVALAKCYMFKLIVAQSHSINWEIYDCSH